MHARRHRRNDWVRINLPVRMVQRDAHFGAAILERQDVFDVGSPPENCGAVGQHLQQQFDMRERHCAQRRLVASEDHHFTLPRCRRSRNDQLGQRLGFRQPTSTMENGCRTPQYPNCRPATRSAAPDRSSPPKGCTAAAAGTFDPAGTPHKLPIRRAADASADAARALSGSANGLGAVASTLSG